MQSYLTSIFDQAEYEYQQYFFSQLLQLVIAIQSINQYILCIFLCLLQATEASHPDKEKLLHARRAQEEVAEFTNEYKRRKDIGMCIDSKTNQ